MTEDVVNKPSHYNQAGIEVIEVIETYTPNSPHLANVLKYVCRHSYKGKPLEDLKKAQWYLNRAIDRMEKQEELQKVLEHARPWSEVKKELELDYPDPSTFEEHELYVHENATPPPMPDTIMVPVITAIHEPYPEGHPLAPDSDFWDDTEQYVTPSLERVPGSDGPVHRGYYGYNPDDVEGHCDECGDAICSRDAKITADHVPGKTFCSIICLAEHKFWEETAK